MIFRKTTFILITMSILISGSEIWAESNSVGEFLHCNKENSSKKFIAIGIGEEAGKLKLINRDSQISLVPKSNCESAYPKAKESYKKLTIPFAKQTENKVCGPASIQMLFNYWGIQKFDQYDIMFSILRKFKNEGRYKGIIVGDHKNFDLKTYPGTGTINMRQFLESFSDVDNGRIKSLPKMESEKKFVQNAFMSAIQSYISRDIPVIVHQNWSKTSTNGHYRIAIGYDQVKQLIILMDARSGEITQSYSEFFELSNVDGEYLPYNFIVFNTQRKVLQIDRLP